MSERLGHIQSAMRVLIRRNTTLHQRLYEAGNELLIALGRSDTWPPEAFAEAKRIEEALTAKGKLVDTVCAMDTPAAADLAERVFELGVALTVAEHLRFETGGHPGVPHPKAMAPVGMSQRREAKG